MSYKNTSVINITSDEDAIESSESNCRDHIALYPARIDSQIFRKRERIQLVMKLFDGIGFRSTQWHHDTSLAVMRTR